MKPTTVRVRERVHSIAAEVEALITEHAPLADNPLGAMGSGEGGCTGVGAAIANAIDDALDAGRTRRLPVTPSRLLTRLQQTGGIDDPS